jgi:hypothetical protein
VAKIGRLQKNAALKIPEQRLPQPPKDEEVMPPPPKELGTEKSDEEKDFLKTESGEHDLPPPPRD